jgi:hypothetical protein
MRILIEYNFRVFFIAFMVIRKPPPEKWLFRMKASQERMCPMKYSLQKI